MTDHEWYESVKAGSDEGWALVREKAVEAEAKTPRGASMMRRYSITQDDLMGMLYEEMMSRGKISLYRDDGGSFQGWLRRYVRGFILNGNPNARDSVSINACAPSEGDCAAVDMELPFCDKETERKEVWSMTHLCFRDLWNRDPERALVLLLKTRFSLSSVEVKEMLDVSSVANVDQIFSRAVKFMRRNWIDREKYGMNPVPGKRSENAVQKK